MEAALHTASTLAFLSPPEFENDPKISSRTRILYLGGSWHRTGHWSMCFACTTIKVVSLVRFLLLIVRTI